LLLQAGCAKEKHSGIVLLKTISTVGGGDGELRKTKSTDFIRLCDQSSFGKKKTN